jgi:peptidyl-prolyl cis-trans isomerase C
MIPKTIQFSAAVLAVTLVACSSVAAATANTNVTAKGGNKIDELFGDPLIAKGKGVEIKRSELDGVLINAKATAAARGQPIPPQYLQMLEQQLLARLIHVRLLSNKATEADKAEGKQRSSKQLDTLFKQTPEDRLELQLKTMGMTKSEFITKVAEEATAQVVAERELAITITPDEAKKYYDDHPSLFEEPEKVKVTHILLSTRNMTNGVPLTEEQKAAKRKLLEDLLKRARAGENFGTLAGKYSEDPALKENGGEITFTRSQTGIPPEFEAAAFALNTNQISDVVTTAYGFHIMKLSEKIPAKKLSYDEVAENLKEGLKQQALLKKLPEYMSQLRKEAKVEILDERLVLPEEPPADLLEPAAAPEKPAQTGEKKN